MIGTFVDDSRNTRNIPSLVIYCQRVLAANIDSITSFGDGVPHRLIKPVLHGCNADTLLRLEQGTPHLQERTSELWKEICVRVYPNAVEQILNCRRKEPLSWREEYSSIKERETKRLEEVASRLRNQRIEAEELKRKRQVKLTDRLPPPKRPRSGSGPAAPKTLFEKTRKEATKIQKNVFGSRLFPPAHVKPKVFQAKVDVPGSKDTEKDRGTIVVNKVAVRTPSKSPLLPSQSSRKVELTGGFSQSKSLGGRQWDSSAVPVQSTVPCKSSSGSLSRKATSPTLCLSQRRTTSQLSGLNSVSSMFTSR